MYIFQHRRQKYSRTQQCERRCLHMQNERENNNEQRSQNQRENKNEQRGQNQKENRK